MDRTKHVWVLLSNTPVCVCNESCAQNVTEREHRVMDADVLSRIATLADKRGWQCTVVADRDGIPRGLAEQVGAMAHRTILPGDGPPLAETAICVPEGKHTGLHGASVKGQGILRVRQSGLGNLANAAVQLLERYADVSIRHPDLLKYRKQDCALYEQQLRQVAEWLLNRESSWTDYRVDVLTDRFGLREHNECGAGDKSLAIAPDGGLHLCPAAFQAGFAPCGHISQDISISNRHLFTRHYGLPCREKCNALHCLRCVYLNKMSTLEFSVPGENLCRISHVELTVQAWLADEAAKRRLWNNRDWRIPKPPPMVDPYQLVKAEGPKRASKMPWQRLLLFDGHTERISPAMMLDMMHTLRTTISTIMEAAMVYGYAVPADRMNRNVLLHLHRKTIERYKECVFQEGCPTIHEIEVLMHRLVEPHNGHRPGPEGKVQACATVETDVPCSTVL